MRYIFYSVKSNEKVFQLDVLKIIDRNFKRRNQKKGTENERNKILSGKSEKKKKKKKMNWPVSPFNFVLMAKPKQNIAHCHVSVKLGGCIVVIRQKPKSSTSFFLPFSSRFWNIYY